MAQKAEIRKIGPTEAAKMLESTGDNRPLSQSHVDWLAAQMSAGTFRLNGQPIILNCKKVLDGQHRLWALVESGKTCEFWVIDGVPDSAFDTIDTGRNRTKADALAIEIGKERLSSRALRAAAAAVNYILSFDNDGRFIQNRRKEHTNHGVIEFTKDNPDFIAEAERVGSLGQSVLPLSMLLTIHWLGRTGFPNAFNEFVRPAVTGVGLEEGSPILALRSKAINRDSGYIYVADKMALTVKAWNAWANGERPRFLRWVAGTDVFPAMKLRPSHEPPKRRRGEAA